jgi:hypothetical protein
MQHLLFSLINQGGGADGKNKGTIGFAEEGTLGPMEARAIDERDRSSILEAARLDSQRY